MNVVAVTFPGISNSNLKFLNRDHALPHLIESTVLSLEWRLTGTTEPCLTRDTCSTIVCLRILFYKKKDMTLY